jgi:beta-mannanase
MVGQRFSALATALVVCALAGAGTATASERTTQLTPPTVGAWFGALVQKRTESNHYEAVLAFEKEIGRKLAIDHHYHAWDALTLGEETKDVAAGRIPMVSWPSGSWPAGVDAKAIASGSQDAIIKAAADRFKTFGAPIFLRFAYEMDQDPTSGRHIGEPADFIAAWKRVHNIFVRRGATNVVWVWCAVSHNFANGRAQSYYPGAAYVDWVAADGWSFWPVRDTPKGTWRSLKEIFSSFYAWGSTTGKPLMIAATGVQEDPSQPTRKAQWFAEATAWLKTAPAIKAFVYWHGILVTQFGPALFWADSTPISLAAYSKMGADPYFNP